MTPRTARTATVGLIGLGAMGRNLGWRLDELDMPLAVYSYDGSEIDRFATGTVSGVVAATSPADLVRQLARPRTILLMVTAGAAVDRVIADLAPLLDAGDVVVDGGNSHFRDTIRRRAELGAHGIGFVGAGISGGEAGARHGASIMAGADAAVYAGVRPVLEALAARNGDSVCAARVGPDGAGHFVKMVHNGIEYALMQLIAETWRTMTDVLGWDRPRQRAAFQHIQRGPAAGYLTGITAEILATPDPDGDGDLLDRIADRAAQKGTGRWTMEAALELGVPIPAITAAVSERMISAGDRHTHRASARPPEAPPVDLRVEDLEAALLAGFIASFSQGFALLAAASEAYGWRLDLATVARIWQGGCIIRTDLLGHAETAFRSTPGSTTLLEADPFRAQLASAEPPWRALLAANIAAGTTPPCTAAALAWYDSLGAARLPTRLIQAQRDYFGAHGFERTDRPGTFHGPWKRS
ncbi:MAG: NADP-dependent phosphogluconate dehydrogenase [Pseudomonadales bacterium]